MNVLILTGRFGMGHYCAAEAVKEEILAGDSAAQVAVVDILEYMTPAFSEKIYVGFNFMVSRCAGLYNFLNGIASKCGSVPLEKTYLNKIEKLLDMYKPDLVVSTLPLCAQYMSAYKRMSGSSLPLYTYITDVEVHEEWIADGTDCYFVGDKITESILVGKGVDKKKILVSGIPVRQAFKSRQLCKGRPEKKELLIMGGGLGLIPLPAKWLKTLCKMGDVNITLIAGKNNKMKHKIEQKFPEIKVIGYTQNVHKYMAAAHIIVSKSGGITTFEAIHSQTPLYIIKPFLMQEVGNAKYVEGRGIGKVAWSRGENSRPEELMEMLEDQELLESMRQNMKRLKCQMRSSSPLDVYNRREAGLCG